MVVCKGEGLVRPLRANLGTPGSRAAAEPREDGSARSARATMMRPGAGLGIRALCVPAGGCDRLDVADQVYWVVRRTDGRTVPRSWQCAPLV